MKRARRPNGSTPYPAISYRMAPEVIQKLKALAVKNAVSDTQMMVNLINGSYARSNLNEVS
jgi:hypothetical protein